MRVANSGPSTKPPYTPPPNTQTEFPIPHSDPRPPTIHSPSPPAPPHPPHYRLVPHHPIDGNRGVTAVCATSPPYLTLFSLPAPTLIPTARRGGARTSTLLTHTRDGLRPGPAPPPRAGGCPTAHLVERGQRQCEPSTITNGGRTSSRPPRATRPTPSRRRWWWQRVTLGAGGVEACSFDDSGCAPGSFVSFATPPPGIHPHPSAPPPPPPPHPPPPPPPPPTVRPRPGQGDHASASSQSNPHIKKTSTHPSEATYPCCIPALGELGDIAPRGGWG